MNELLEEYKIEVKPFEQQLPTSCGQSSLRTVLYHYYRVDFTDRELSIMLGSGSDGTSDFDAGLKILGLTYKQSDKGTLNKLKSFLLKDLLPIVHVVMHDGCGHYMVVVGYDKDSVYLSDPSVGKIIKYGISYFLGIWKVEEDETQTRWFITVTGKRKRNKINVLIKKLRNIKKKIERA